MRLKKEEKTSIISAMLAELSFRDKAASARDLFHAAFPNQAEPSCKSMAGLSKILAKECKYITSPHVWQLKLFYVKESQIKDIDFKELEALYVLHNTEQIARQRFMRKCNDKCYRLSEELVAFIKAGEPPWEIDALKQYHNKRIELAKQCTKVIKAPRQQRKTLAPTQSSENAV